MAGRGRPRGDEAVLQLLAAELAQPPARAGLLLPSADVLAALFDAAAHDAEGGAEEQEEKEEEEEAEEAEAEEGGGGGAPAAALRGRRVDGAGVRMVLTEVCRRAVARVTEVAPAGSPLPALVDERLRDCLEDGVAEAEAAGPQSLRQFRNNAVGSVHDALYRILSQP